MTYTIAVDFDGTLHDATDYVNENSPERIEAFGGDTRKISADMYIDDRVRLPERIEIMMENIE